jgi:carnitine O-acetyltransferase
MRVLQSVLLEKNKSSHRLIAITSSKTLTSRMTPSIVSTREFHGLLPTQQQQGRQHEPTRSTTYAGYTHRHTNRWNSTTAKTVATSHIRPWPDQTQGMIESHGDYRDETWLEEYIGGPLYQYQKSLPILPVISNLSTTLQRLAPTILPLAKNDAEVSNVQSCLSKFPNQAEHLQERLHQHAQNIGTSSSWLQQWWNTYCYLQVRDSVVINVSYFFHFQSDPTVTNIVQRAATIAYTTGQFRNLVASGQFPAEQIGKGRTPLCSVAYKYMLHACRIPQPTQDTYRIYDPSKHHHVIVSIRGQYYKVPLFNASTNEPYSVPIIENAIQQCIDLANQVNDSQLLQLGWCTSSNRDKWANVRQQLLNVGGIEMEQALRDIESGVVVICLDLDDTPVSRTEIAKMLLHGSTGASSSSTADSATGTGGNRWFDKSIQFIISNHGKAAGLLGEHSMMDGMPVVQLANYVTKKSHAECCQESHMNHTNDHSTSPVATIRVQPIFSPELYNKIRSVAEPSIEVGKSTDGEFLRCRL